LFGNNVLLLLRFVVGDLVVWWCGGRLLSHYLICNGWPLVPVKGGVPQAGAYETPQAPDPCNDLVLAFPD